MKLSELEVKIALNENEFKFVFESCRNLYGEPTYILQLDEYFDTPDKQLRSQDFVLRIRSINGNQLVAMKSPRVNLPSGLSNRIELEFTAAEGSNVKIQLENQGVIPSQASEKERWTFHSGETEILLDRLPFLGTFIEVEGPNESAIEDVLKTLKISHLPRIQKNYGELMREKLKELELTHLTHEATFAAEQNWRKL